MKHKSIPNHSGLIRNKRPVLTRFSNFEDILIKVRQQEQQQLQQQQQQQHNNKVILKIAYALQARDQKHLWICVLSGHFSLGWTKSKIAIVRDHDGMGMAGTLDINVLWTPKGFGLRPLTAKI